MKKGGGGPRAVRHKQLPCLQNQSTLHQITKQPFIAMPAAIV